MTDNNTDDGELWLWMTPRELRALNDADRQRALAAMTGEMKKALDSDEPFTGSARALTEEQLAQMKRARQLRAERMSRPPYTEADTTTTTGTVLASAEFLHRQEAAMADEADPEDWRLTMDLVALYDITRDYAVDLEYVLAERKHAADTAEARARYERRWREVRAERRSLPLGTDAAARRGLVAAQDLWRDELATLQALASPTGAPE